MSGTVQVQVGDGATQPKVIITITELSTGTFRFELVQSGAVIGDLRGLFFDVGQEANLTAASVSGLSAVTQTGQALAIGASAVKGNDSVTKVAGSDTTMSGALAFNGKGAEATGYDVGVEFGTSGVGKDDVGGVSFTLNLGKVTLADLAGQDFGLRMTSVGVLGGAREASLKLTGASFAVAPDADEAPPPALENASAAGDLVRDAFANTDGGQVKQALAWASLDGGQTKFALGSAQVLGDTGATIVVRTDGGYVIDAQGCDALAEGVSVAFKLTYGVAQTYFDAIGHQVGQLAETSAMTFTVAGVNDAPVVSGALFGAAAEDGAAVKVNALANASDVDTGAVLKVVGVAALPAGVAYDPASQAFTLDPADAAFQSLAEGQTTTVRVAYGVSDGYVTVPTYAEWTVTGTNDAPVVSGAVAGQATEDAAKVSLNALQNASDVDAGARLCVVGVPAELPAGVAYDAATGLFTLDPAHAAFQALGAGETLTVRVDYGVSDGALTTGASVQWTVTGVAEPVVAPAPAPAPLPAPLPAPVASPALVQPAITGDHFPTAPKDISHVTLYFETSPNDGKLDLRTVKVDNVPGAANDDLDAWLNQALEYVRAHDAGLPAGAQLLGGALKYATTEIYYGLDGDTDADAAPGGVLVQNHSLNASFNYSAIFG
ncbi:cadherin-like domain-containing protein [Phenylobacterium sp.]|uniref:cadherin-like domain-containing protein n=1 Tax=Phenylobacterium sp. TaxID=1871053 RepID=UPI0035AED6C6